MDQDVDAEQSQHHNVGIVVFQGISSSSYPKSINDMSKQHVLTM